MNARNIVGRMPAWVACVLLIGVIALPACRSKAPKSPTAQVREAPAEMPSYYDLARRYNANVERINRLWSSANVELEWRDKSNKRRWEQGEGNLILVLPDRVSLSVGKLGNTMMWAGSDPERYWLFDLQGDKAAYVGQHRHVGKACAEALPLPIQPLDLVQLLGIVPLDVEDPHAGAAGVEWVSGRYVIEPPGRSLRMALDPVTAMPVRIDLLDERGYSRVVSQLSRTAEVEVMGVVSPRRPRMNTRIEVTVPDRTGRMVLFLSRLTDGREAGKINSNVFDFDFLAGVLKPAEVTVLDQSCSD